MFHVSADIGFDCDYWQISDENGPSMAVPISSCLITSSGVGTEGKLAYSSKCNALSDDITFLQYLNQSHCENVTNSTTYNKATAKDIGLTYQCREPLQCPYVRFNRHGPHPIKCDDLYHVWEEQTFVTGCYPQMAAAMEGIEDMDYGLHRSVYYGCNATNIIIEYYSKEDCRREHPIGTKVVESCECRGADCYSYHVQECTDRRSKR